ncbi:MAG: hypothetical protein ACOX4I_08270 [Anaerovoracaceae bacterium]|jgi:hypothetical protein
MRMIRDNKIRAALMIIMVVILAIGTTSLAAAAGKIVEDQSPEVSEYDYEPIRDSGVFSAYCGFTHDVKLTTLERSKYVAEGTIVTDGRKTGMTYLERAIIRGADSEFLNYGEHTKTSDIKVTGVDSKDLKNVRLAKVDSGYKVIDNVTLELEQSNGAVASMNTKVILVHAEKINDSDNSNTNGSNSGEVTDEDVGGDDIDEGDDSAAADDSEAAGTKKSKAPKKSVGRISKKDNSDRKSPGAGVNYSGNDGGSGTGGADTAGIVLCSLAGLAALLFALSIISDFRVIRWFNQKKALRRRR